MAMCRSMGLIANSLLAALLCANAIAQQPEFIASTPSTPQDEVLLHRLQVLLDPRNSRLEVEDALLFPSAQRTGELSFTLNSNLQITASSIPVRPATNATSTSTYVASTANQGAELTTYRFTPPRRWNGQLQLSYQGIINDQLARPGAEYAQSFSETSGIISEQGVFLSRASAWVPEFGDQLLNFQMQVDFAAGVESWSVVTQGITRQTEAIVNGNSTRQTWFVESTPQEEIYLIAADFTVYEQQAGEVQTLAYLRSPDPNLATKYLDATARYLALYDPLLGDYPYGKFALVENFWETGYGMPSFTLLGPQVIRFPFILETSYPHEILHNWWGNGVYPDYSSGNWSEGLTAYLADHLFREMDGLGHEYRKEMLARYKNYVAEGNDFPLSEFTSRNSAATQAVGYGKTLMLWHMLRIELGDELFLQGLRSFYADYLFKRASWSDIQQHFSELAGRDLSAFFSQWIDRVGAPELSVSVEETNDNRARIMFAQVQLDDPYQLTVPVALFYEGEEQPQVYNISLSQKLEGVMAENYDQLRGVLIDPYFDVFRTLDREETPATLGELFGASEISFILPTDNRLAWTQMAQAFGEGLDAEILYADQIEALPSDRSVWVLGRDNPFAEQVAEAGEKFGVSLNAIGVEMAGQALEYADRSTVLVTRHPDNADLAVGLVHIDNMIALPGMIEKLPHYGKYSYLSFTGSEPTNDVSGIWESPDSPMQWRKPDLAEEIAWDNLPAETPLAELPPEYGPDQMRRHVLTLTASEMQGRGIGSPGLDKAAQYLADQFRQAGLQTVNGTYLQKWQATLPGHGHVELANVVGLLPGANRQLSNQPVIIGAHYDHLGIDADSGRAFPGADDNASGVAVLLEVAANLSRSYTPERPILFVLFSGEEEGLLGSSYFVRNPPAGFDAESFYAMVNLDTVGRLEGRNLQVFATDSAYEWPFMAQGIGFTIGLRASFPTQTIASSDHVSFLNAGVPAIHLFSGVHNDYHRVSDSADKLDLQGMSQVALWLEEAAVYLGSNVEPLRNQLAGAAPIEQSGQTGEREASLGTVPDFSWSGEGVRISGVTPGGAAEQAGLQAGDVLLRFNTQPIEDLQHYSDLLRAAAPGDSVALGIRRAGRILTLDVELQSR